MGEILGANNEIEQILGYKKHDIIRENINKIMPAIIAQKHDKFIQNHFYKMHTKSSDIYERHVLPMHREGALLPCTLLNRQIPNLTKGIQFMGFLLFHSDISYFRHNEDSVENQDVLYIQR